MKSNWVAQTHSTVNDYVCCPYLVALHRTMNINVRPFFVRVQSNDFEWSILSRLPTYQYLQCIPKTRNTRTFAHQSCSIFAHIDISHGYHQRTGKKNNDMNIPMLCWHTRAEDKMIFCSRAQIPDFLPMLWVLRQTKPALSRWKSNDLHRVKMYRRRKNTKDDEQRITYLYRTSVYIIRTNHAIDVKRKKKRVNNFTVSFLLSTCLCLTLVNLKIV